MKKSIFIALLVGAMLLSACKANAVNHERETTPTGFSAEDSYVSESVTFVWEEVGFGGEFVITLEPLNTFQMCEGPLSSTVYRGYFYVDGDVVTLRSATSTEYKEFLFRINDDKTELTFIADGSDELPFCKLEDGALFSTEFHHDDSEYWGKKDTPSDSEDPGKAIAAYIGDDVTGVKITHVLMGQLTEWNIEGNDIEDLRLWANGLEYELREFEDGNTPGDEEGQEAYWFELTGGDYPGFDYIICGPDDCYLLIESDWYVVKNPSDPPVKAP